MVAQATVVALVLLIEIVVFTTVTYAGYTYVNRLSRYYGDKPKIPVEGSTSHSSDITVEMGGDIPRPPGGGGGGLGGGIFRAMRPFYPGGGWGGAQPPPPPPPPTAPTAPQAAPPPPGVMAPVQVEVRRTRSHAPRTLDIGAVDTESSSSSNGQHPRASNNRRNLQRH